MKWRFTTAGLDSNKRGWVVGGDVMADTIDMAVVVARQAGFQMLIDDGGVATPGPYLITSLSISLLPHE